MGPRVLKTVLTFVIIINFSKQDDDIILSDFIEKEILDNLNESSSYNLPVDNSKYFENLTDNIINDYGTFDFIIIGSGSTGSVLANRLSATRSWRILLLEAGDQDNVFSNIPGMYSFTLNSKFNWGYNTTSQKNGCKAFINNQCAIPRGKILGGSSSINCLIYTRGNPRDYDEWEDLGNTGWSYEDVEPSFKKMENAQFASDLGHSGPLYINYTSPTVKLEDIFSEALLQFDIPPTEYNSHEQIGTSKIQYNIKKGRRISGSNAYIRPALHRENLNVTLNAFVTKIHIDDKSKIATGVQFVRNGKMYLAKCAEEIILSAGAINSPQILMLSGIGPESVLEKFKIPIKQILPVGEKLMDQIAFNLYFSSNYTQELIPLKTQIKDFLNGEGLLTSAFNGKSLAFTKNNGSRKPNVEYVLTPPSGGSDYITKFKSPYIESINNEYMKKINMTNFFSIVIILLHPKSIGNLRIQSDSPKDFPLIDSGLFNVKEDIEELYKAIKFIINVTLHAESFKKINSSVFSPIPPCYKHEMYSREYWYCAIEYMALPTYHNMGTTPMGKDPKFSVVNHELKVHGIGKLRVADCGIVPVGISGHTSGPAFMIGEKLASMINKEYRVN